ncbi:MAG: tRNA (guanosine(37)-N1)-methyltransferase TrmD [Actinobacteria bacterium]|nr:tRNA (guanosine(37)-N1)-methyltransferase TrmD [Actinomycetota bacterium]
MRIDVFTIFPSIFEAGFSEGILRIAQEKNLIKINIYNLRDFTFDKHRQVDDVPYGGGSGMVMKPEPFFDGVGSLCEGNLEELKKKARIILLSPQGIPLNQKVVKALSEEDNLILLCGRYEGVDERVREYLVTDEISIGDYILSGGEFAAMVLIDSVVRLIPDVLGNEYSKIEETFSKGLLEYPHYTRPSEYKGWKVPEVLLSGNHKEIEKWRVQNSLKRTLIKRPDLLKDADLSEEEKVFIDKIKLDEK